MTINASHLLPVRTASCSVMGDYALKKKMTVPYSKAKKGDVVLYDFNGNGTSDHTGIIYSVSGGKIYVVEGNTSKGNNCNGGMVMKRVRVKGNVNYIIRPKYTKEVTADMVVATAIAEVGVKESPSGSNKVKYNDWFYGKTVRGSAYPWCMTFVQWCFAHVQEPKAKPKPITKPTGKYTGTIAKPVLKKGSKGEQVKNLQRFLNWYHPAWKVNVDGKFGKNTEKVVKEWQKVEKLTVDGNYGKKSYARALTYKSAVSAKKTTTPTKTSTTTKKTATAPKNAQKLLSKMKELAWAYGTASKKYDYKTGAPKAVCKTAMKKYGWADNRAEMSDCGNFVSTVVRESGVSKTFKALHGVKTAFPKSEKGFTLVLSGKKIPKGFLKAGDIIRYKKKNGKQHAMFYFGDGKICEASHHSRFGCILKDNGKYNDVSKPKTIQVWRAKE